MTHLALFSLALALFPTPALAEPIHPGEVVVRTADLDLATASGQRSLERRLAQAVVDACGEASDVDLAGSNEVRRCRDETRARIEADRERLTRLAARAAPIVVAAR